MFMIGSRPCNPPKPGKLDDPGKDPSKAPGCDWLPVPLKRGAEPSSGACSKIAESTWLYLGCIWSVKVVNLYREQELARLVHQTAPTLLAFRTLAVELNRVLHADRDCQACVKQAHSTLDP